MIGGGRVVLPVCVCVCVCIKKKRHKVEEIIIDMFAFTCPRNVQVYNYYLLLLVQYVFSSEKEIAYKSVQTAKLMFLFILTLSHLFKNTLRQPQVLT